MNYQFAVALDRPAAVRNMEATISDDFNVAVSIYDADGAEAKASLTDSTIVLSLDRACGIEASFDGSLAAGVATFDLSGADLASLVGRNVWRVVLTRAGRSATILRGVLTVTR